MLLEQNTNRNLNDPDPTLADAIAGGIRRRTGGRLRNLEIQFEGSRFCVTGMAASYHVRQLAEQAALGVLTADRLRFAIRVEP